MTQLSSARLLIWEKVPSTLLLRKVEIEEQRLYLQGQHCQEGQSYTSIALIVAL